MYKRNLALTNQQWLICHNPPPKKKQPNQTKLVGFATMFVKLFETYINS